MANIMHAGRITSLVTEFQSCITHHTSTETLQNSLGVTRVTNKLEEILTPLENSNDNSSIILIEGPPGIGKSVLLKEIAYRWGEGYLLQKFKMVLLVCLRESNFQQAKTIPDLLRYFCKGDPDATELSNACSKYFLKNGGKDLVFLFDGFDELPEKLQKDGLIADILKRLVLPCCGLVVSSRPHVTKQLQARATLKVDILGFTEQERRQHIEQALQGQPHKIRELIQYFERHVTIGNLCYIPFNLVVLLYLYKQGFFLPKNSAELYSYVIQHTINRHLIKHGHPTNITKLTDLPEPCNKIFQQLCRLSLEALNDNKSTFTLDEIKLACPDIVAIPEAINGLGLLQAVERFDHAGTSTTFSFVHFTIQEYLAAHHVANLPAEEELKVIEDKIWSNMFSIYIALTKGRRPSFKRFLCGGDEATTIADKFLNDQLLCFRLFRYFHEAANVDICTIIEQSVTFRTEEIDLSGTTLTASDVECVTVFLTSSLHKRWLSLNLHNCYIQDHGLNILHHGLLDCSGVTINELGLMRNSLTQKSSSLISDIVIRCKVVKLVLIGNQDIGENQQIFSMLTDSSTKLEELYMSSTELSSSGAINLFEASKKNNKLRVLYIDGNAITDDACLAITTTLKENNHLVMLRMYNNPLNDEAILGIVKGLKVNNTLVSLGLPKCSEENKKEIKSLQEVINKERENQGCQVKLMIYY